MRQYGGNPGDWKKKSTSEDIDPFNLEEDICAPGEENRTTLFKQGTNFEIHWYELKGPNGVSRLEFKIAPI